MNDISFEEWLSRLPALPEEDVSSKIMNAFKGATLPHRPRTPFKENWLSERGFNANVLTFQN